MSRAGSRRTSTQAFGSSRRESHDASGFYSRFVPPALSQDTTVNRPTVVDTILHDDARRIAELIPPNSVALVVTSPPYFAGKQYEETLGENGVPGSYFEYLELLREVFAGCAEVLEPGGRIAVNVANLGRRPYRSLAGDVTTILQDLGLLMRGEVIWWKGRAAGGSCAWGTFQRPNNPVLRDVTERIVIASKGRFDRALSAKERQQRNLPSTATISRDEFLEATTDLWELPPASATQVGHPAPFPVELPQRLIDLYTYEGDAVLDPFMGAGTTAVAAVRTDRRFIGFETDEAYIQRAQQRISDERRRLAEQSELVRAELPALAGGDFAIGRGIVEQAMREGRQANYVAETLLRDAGFRDIRPNVKHSKLGVELGFVATDASGVDWAFDVSGGFTSTPSGLRTSDALWRALGKAAVLHSAGVTAEMPLVLLSTDLPAKASAQAKSLRAATGPGKPVFDVIDLLDPDGHARLRSYAERGRT